MGFDTSRFRGQQQGKEWLDWLDDEPIPSNVSDQLRKRAAAKAKAKAAARAASTSSPRDEPETVAINITIPEFHKPDLVKLAKKVRQKLPDINLTKFQQRALIAVMAVGVISAVAVPIYVKKQDNGTTGVLGQASETPSFKAVLPDGKESETTSDKVAYDAQRKVASYTDMVGGIKVTVSQQALPETFKDSPEEKVKKLAESFAANEVISTSSPTAYLGTSVKGPQTVIFTKNGLLIFIQSAQKIDKPDWAEYITKLQ